MKRDITITTEEAGIIVCALIDRKINLKHELEMECLKDYWETNKEQIKKIDELLEKL